MKKKIHKKKKLTQKQANILKNGGEQRNNGILEKLVKRGLITSRFGIITKSGARRLFMAGVINKKERNRYLRDGF
ncbi:MAG: hypothetical protein WCL18_01350 [bacterium]